MSSLREQWPKKAQNRQKILAGGESDCYNINRIFPVFRPEIKEALLRMKSKIFRIVGLVMGCISVSISVTGLVFSAIGLAKTKGIRAPRKF